MVSITSMGASGMAGEISRNFIYVPIIEASGTVIKNYGNVGPANFLGVDNLGKLWNGEAPWVANRKHEIGNFCEPTTRYVGFRYEVTAVAGDQKTHATTEPTFEATAPNAGDTIVDDQVTWTTRATETGRGIVHGSGMENASDTDCDYIWPGAAQYDVPGDPLFDMLNFWDTGKLFIRFRARVPGYQNVDDGTGYISNGGIITVGTTGSGDSTGWALTLNSIAAWAGLNYVDHGFVGAPIEAYGSRTSHQDLTGGVLSFDDTWQEISVFMDGINKNIRSWVDGVETTIGASEKADFITGITADDNGDTILVNSLTLLTRSLSVTAGTRSEANIVTGATAALANEFLIVDINDETLLDQLAQDLFLSPRNYLPKTLTTLV